jgi:hypothetical protein
MPRRNHAKGRRPQAQRGRSNPFPTLPDVRGTFKNGLPQKPKSKSTRPSLLPMVPSVGTCPLGKIRYGTEEDAAEALRRALINREILQSPVVEERWYPQPGDAPCTCQGYHLTSSPRRAR